MRVSLKELLLKLGIDRELYPYETQPWYLHDEEQGITCSAEIRMGPDSKDVEAEIQTIKDDNDDDDSGGSGSGDSTGGIQQIMFMRAEPAGNNEWTPKFLRIKGDDLTNTLHDWETKCCDFFAACIQSINMGKMPDIDVLIEKNLQEDDMFGGGGRGRIGRKSPKIKPAQVLGMKKGG